MKRSIRCGTWLAAGLVLAWLTGCGQDGPQRHDISGEVTYQGAPVPEGNISFEPVESEIGGGFAFIQDGKFDTSTSGRGHLGGTHTVRITGSTGELINPNNPDLGSPSLFEPYETSLDLPAEESTRDFEVPSG